ncbi:MAG: hypothetical protein ACJAUD_002162 [Crocinitomicaceae bacterium]
MVYFRGKVYLKATVYFLTAEEKVKLLKTSDNAGKQRLCVNIKEHREVFDFGAI